MMFPIDMAQLLQECAPTVAPTTMNAIIRVESRHRPHSISQLIQNSTGKFLLKRQPQNLSEAIQWAEWLLTNGYRFDAGIAQINSRNWNAYRLTPSTVFDPCLNVAAGAAILTLEYRRAWKKYGNEQVALRAALSSYNTGNFDSGLQNGYVAKIEKAAGVRDMPAALLLIPASEGSE